MNKSKSISFKYKAKIKSKQPGWYWYFSFPLIGIGFYMLCLATEQFTKSLEALNIYLNFPGYFYLLSIIATLLLSLFAFSISPITPFKIQRTRIKLKRIIEENGFFYEDSETKIIKSSMIIKFYWENQNLNLEVYPNGGKYTSRMNELTAIFQTTFNMNVIAVQADYPNHTTYILSNEENNYIDVTNQWN